MKPKILFLGTGMVPDGRFNFFYEPFQERGIECHIISSGSEREVFGTCGHFQNYTVCDYPSDEGEAFRRIYDFCRRTGINVILSLFEDTVLLGAKLRTALDISGQKYEQAIWFRNKYAMKRRFELHGIPCARFAKIDRKDDLDQFALKIGYPIVLKPLNMCGTVSVLRCNTETEAMSHLAEMLAMYPEGILAEEFVRGRELSCDSVVSNGRVVYSAMTRYAPTVIDTMEKKDVGLSVVLANDADENEREQVGALAENVIKAMEFESGFTHMELFSTDNGYIAGEIAARPPGARIIDLHNISQGMNVGRLLCDMVVDGDTSFCFDRRYSAGVYFLSTSRRGVVSGIGGMDAIRNREEVVGFKIPETGTEINEKAHSCDDIGYVLFRSESSSNIERAIAAARQNIMIELN